MPPGIVDRPVKYLVNFVSFDDVMQTLGGYEIVMVTHSPSSNYNVLGEHLQGISLILRSKEMPSPPELHSPGS